MEMKTSRIYERIFREASKRRFIEPVWQGLINNEYNAGYIMKLTNYPDKALPNIDSIIKWVDSGAADKYNIDWQSLQSKGKDDEVVRIINGYYDYYNKGGSIKDRKALAKEDVKQVFRDRIATFCESGNCSGYDMALLDENEKFIFVVPLTHAGAEWMDSFDCGGEGARWCIGTSDDEGYWEDYISDSNWFILAFNKEVYNQPKNKRKEDTLKYMIQLSSYAGDTQAWRQSDDPENTIPISEFEHIFGRSAVELGEAFVLQIACDDNVYSNNLSDQMYDYETAEFKNPWSIESLLNQKLFLTDLYSGKANKADIEDLIERHECIIIDCEGEEFHPEAFSNIAYSLVKNPGEIYDADSNCKMLDLARFIQSFGDGNYIHLTFINGVFDCIYISDGIGSVDVYFEGCEINKVYYYKYHMEGTINFQKDTTIENIYWGCEGEYFDCEVRNLNFGKEPYYEYYLPEESDIDD